MKKDKGAKWERELAQILWDKGFACIRGPASGARVQKRFCPDLVALKNGCIFIFEIKYRKSREPIYIEKDKINKLLDFAERAGGYAFIAIRIRSEKKWRFVKAEELDETPESFKISPEKIERAYSIRDLCAIADKTPPLLSFSNFP
ncbi:MAG: Holliday junction resolvase [Thermoprotei archaeon]|nr:MAG: Holliday junction resolvase [Thermoprotei archaeon]RLF00417.1 MAG: Holliday junction resolvase [Thermoprotei archaeon]HDI74981.1 Holliday junction resolvase [Thermoprotei archaeon]